MTKLVVDFQIIFDAALSAKLADGSLATISQEKVLSLVNDFEDGEWRHNTFQNFIWDNIADTALSFREREALVDKSQTKLVRAAKNLRLTDESGDQGTQGSELAEIVLYGIMKNHYRALPVVPKIFHKQNVQDNAKGVDSVHIVVGNNNQFSVWFGEAKFYNSIEDDRLSAIILSIQNSLQLDRIKKENSILTNILDLKEILRQEPNLYEEIVSVLSPSTSVDKIKSKLHIPILLLHECKITLEHNEMSQNYLDEVKEYHLSRAKSFFNKQRGKLKDSVHKFSEIHFHLILFPVPEKQKVIEKFIQSVKYYKSI